MESAKLLPYSVFVGPRTPSAECHEHLPYGTGEELQLLASHDDIMRGRHGIRAHDSRWVNEYR